MTFIKKYFKQILIAFSIFLIAYFWEWFFILLISFIIAYLLEPVVKLLEKIKIKRLFSVIIILIITIFLFSLLFIKTVPPMINQFKKFNENIPEYTKQFVELTEIVKTKVINLNLPNNDIKNALISKVEYIIKFISNAMIRLLFFLPSSIIYMILIPIIVFYFLKDKDFFIEHSLKLFKSKRRGRKVLEKINKSVMGYIKGTLFDCLIASVILTVGFYIFQLKYALITGIIAGLLVLVPYIGPLIGMILPIVIAVIQFQSFQPVFFLIIFMLIVHLINGYVIQPKIIGERIQFHPLSVLFIVSGESDLLFQSRLLLLSGKVYIAL